MLAYENFNGPHVWDKPGLSGDLVCLVHLVSLRQPNKRDKPNNGLHMLAPFFSFLLELVERLIPEDSERFSCV